jgi:ABC-type lipoprotein export system ATPase subunit
LIDIFELEFSYSKGGFRLSIQQLHVPAGERVALIGPSGSGKSTLLQLMAGILLPQAGRLTVDDRELPQLSDAARRDFRIANIGLVFQEFELLEYLTVFDNILLPYRINDSLQLSDSVRKQAEQLASDLVIADKLARYPNQLSQGEKQRVAIGRALITKPALLLADEPTGNLDPRNKHRILDLLLHHADQRGVTVAMVTHDHGLLDRFQRVIDVGDFHQYTNILDTPAPA